jgi:hypothetical protein
VSSIVSVRRNLLQNGCATARRRLGGSVVKSFFFFPSTGRSHPQPLQVSFEEAIAEIGRLVSQTTPHL